MFTFDANNNLNVNSVAPSTQPVSGTVTVQQATGTNLHAVIDAGTAVIGHVIADTGSTTAVTGTVAENLTQVAGTVLGATAVTNFGTAPAAVAVPGVNSSLFIGTTAAVASSAGVQRVGITGSSTALLDTSMTAAATAPTNGLGVLSVNLTTPPSLTTGQAIGLQSDYEGSLFVKPYRRGQTVSQATPIAANTITPVLAAQAAGIFADISTLIITAAGIATSVATTATLTDGTKNYVFDFIPGTATVAGESPLNFSFNPPLPATTAATAWSITMSTANQVHVTVVAVLQKAS